jgi:L-lactate utilization protein LutB
MNKPPSPSILEIEIVGYLDEYLKEFSKYDEMEGVSSYAIESKSEMESLINELRVLSPSAQKAILVFLRPTTLS